jgi:hypothetical protein
MYSRWGGIKLWYRAGRRKLKGDASVYRMYCFRFICETHLSNTHLNQMWDTLLWACLQDVKSETHVIEARLRLGVYTLNILGPARSLITLSKISKHSYLVTSLCPNHPRHLSHLSSKKWNQSFHTCVQDVQIPCTTNNMASRYNISIIYKLRSLQNDPWVRKKNTEQGGNLSVGAASTGTTGG